MEIVTLDALLIKEIYRSTSNDFSVYVIKLDDLTQKEMVITGYLPKLIVDQMYTFYGIYSEHPRYGLQLQVQSYETRIPTNREAVIKFLSSSQFPGIGKIKATRIVDHYSQDIVNIIKDDSKFEFDDDFLSNKEKLVLIDVIRSQIDLEQVINFFTRYNITLRQTMKIQSVYGSKAMEIVLENPYRMIDDIDGIGFKTVDKIAASLGFERDHPKRLQAIIVYESLQRCMATGSTYVTYEELKSSCLKYGMSDFQFDENLIECNKNAQVIQDSDEDYYHHSQYTSEQICASYFYNMPVKEMDESEKNIEELLTKYEKKTGIIYDILQKQAILSFFNNDKTIITGGPGTGKTTIVEGIIALLREAFPYYQIAICAPTGRAAKRLKELVEVDVSTIHSLLEWNLETNTFGRNHANPLHADILVVDEFSMVDSYTMAALCDATPFVRKIVFIGDKDQLPSVGPGFLIRDLIMSQQFVVTTLEHNYRQDSGSNIISLAKSVNNGVFDLSLCKQDVSFFDSDEQLRQLVMTLYIKAMDSGYRVDDIQVLAPKYEGTHGIDALNFMLQKALNPNNPKKRELKFGYMTFREGDKLLQLKNQPDDFVFNGDTGILIEIIYKDESDDRKDHLIVDFDGVIVEYNPDTFIHLKHAYCMSVHKAQGSEYPVVIFVGSRQHRFMMQKRLLYTGLTRAKNALICIGDVSVFSEACQKEYSDEIMTKLVERIQRLSDM